MVNVNAMNASMTTYFNFKVECRYVRMLNSHFWIKRGGASPSTARILHSHHSWLQDVATPTVQPEEPLVEVHVDVRVLEIQCHHLNATSPHDEGVVVGRIKSCSFWVGPHKLTLSAGKHIYINNGSYVEALHVLGDNNINNYTESEVIERYKDSWGN